MRGEKTQVIKHLVTEVGSPPHARGKDPKPKLEVRKQGITPACAGKSRSNSAASWAIRDHPRMRGEKPRDEMKEYAHSGSPPHARGKGLNTSIICCILAQNTYLHRNFV